MLRDADFLTDSARGVSADPDVLVARRICFSLIGVQVDCALLRLVERVVCAARELSVGSTTLTELGMFCSAVHSSIAVEPVAVGSPSPLDVSFTVVSELKLSAGSVNALGL